LKNKQAIIAVGVIFGVLLIDQLSKLWIKTTMVLGEEIDVLPWFKIHFVENEGMAFGLELGGGYGKLLLSSFRLIASALIIVLLNRLIRSRTTHTGFIICISLILAGALGNIIDSIFYGILFSDSYSKVATFLPADGGYASLLHGKVVDMLYFPLFEGFLPRWIPFFGGQYFLFFRAVFNVADSAISIGVFLILLFQRSFFPAEKTETTPVVAESNIETNPIVTLDTDASLSKEG
jgi:signal peptidase II